MAYLFSFQMMYKSIKQILWSWITFLFILIICVLFPVQVKDA